MYLLFDIGGTYSRFAASPDGQTLGTVEKISTPKNFDEAMLAFSKLVGTLCRGEKIERAVGCSVGPLDTEKSHILNAPNLPDWNHKPLRDTLEKMCGCPVIIENDADLAGIGEATFGAGKGKSIVVYYTISTGVGGTRIVDGKIDVNRFGMEPGQQIIDPYDPTGHLEGLVSGTAIEKHYGKKASKIKDATIWDKVAHHLALGLHNSIVHWSPDIVILGGSVMKSLSSEKVHTELKSIMKIFPGVPPIVEARLDEPALYGALALLKK